MQDLRSGKQMDGEVEPLHIGWRRHGGGQLAGATNPALKYVTFAHHAAYRTLGAWKKAFTFTLGADHAAQLAVWRQVKG